MHTTDIHALGPRKLIQVEITEIPPLSPGEVSLLDFHSVVNVLNVLRCELLVIGDTLAGDMDLLKDSLKACDDLLGAMHDHEATLHRARRLGEFEQCIQAEIAAKAAEHSTDPALLADSLANMASVFSIMHLRASELLARAAEPARWERYEVTALTESLRQVFVAIAQNSKGRFRVLSNAALQTSSDYFIDLNFETPTGYFVLPPVFLDVMRDLIANARKYTEPGGDIIAALYQDDRGTHFVVKDTGRGIPEEELDTVVQFGKRASNVTNVRTLGGGFGLTKAFYNTKQFGGRFWIASALGKGTEVRFWLPPQRPA